MIIGINGYSGSGKDTVGKMIQDLTSPDIPEYGRFDKGQWLPMKGSSPWTIKKWAGKLKVVASLLTGIPVEKFEDQEFKKTYLPEQWNYWTVSVISDGDKLLFQQGRFNTKEDAQGYAGMLEVTHGVFGLEYVVGMQQMTVRQFLQELGTDACRNGLHPNTWVNALMADYTPVTHSDRDPGGFVYPNWIITDTRFPNEAKAIKDAGGIIIRVDRPGVKAINAHPSETGLDDWEFDHKIWNGSDLIALSFTIETILKQHKLLYADYSTKD